MNKTRKPLMIQLVVGLILSVGELPFVFLGIQESFQNGSIEGRVFLHLFVMLAGVLNIIVYFRARKRYLENAEEKEDLLEEVVDNLM